MKLEEEIKVSKEIKKMKDTAKNICESIEAVAGNQPEDAIKMAYTDGGALLQEYNYLDRISQISKDGISTIEEAGKLNYFVNDIPAEDLLESKSKFYCALTVFRESIESALEKSKTGDLGSYKFLADAYSYLK